MSPGLEAPLEDRLSPTEAAQVYLLFAALFRQAPTRELLQAMGETEWAQQVEAIQVEFASLFLVPGGEMLLPYESVYCDTLAIDTSTACSAYFASEPSMEGLKGFIGGPSASQVRQAYRQAGFEMDPAFHDLPDHLSVELEFLGRFLQAGREDEARQFFATHLDHWVFRFLEKLEVQQVSGFYREVADALGLCLRLDFDRDDSKR